MDSESGNKLEDQSDSKDGDDVQVQIAAFLRTLQIYKASRSTCKCDTAIDWRTMENEIAPFPSDSSCGAMCQRRHGISRCGEGLTLAEYSRRFIPSPGVVTPLCSVHQKQIRSHLVCPICGVFIESGKVTSCSPVSEKKSQQTVHLFHRSCISTSGSSENLLGLDCPHCGKALDNAVDVVVHGIPRKKAIKEKAVDVLVYPPPIRDDVAPRRNRFFSPLSDFMPFTFKSLRRKKDVREMLELIEELEKMDMDLPETSDTLDDIVKTDDPLSLALYLIRNCPCGSKPEVSVALNRCVALNKLVFVHLLNSAEVPLDIPDKRTGLTPVMSAALKGHHDLVRYLVDEGCNFMRKERRGRNALQFLLKDIEGQRTILELMENGVISPTMLPEFIRDVNVPEIIRSYAQKFIAKEVDVWKDFKRAVAENDEATMCSLYLFNFEELTGNRIKEIELLCRNNLDIWRMFETKWNQSQSELVICPDITFGSEVLPVKVIGRPGDVDPSTTFSYISRSVLPPGIKISMSIETYTRCSCGERCEPGSCDCREASCKTFDEDELLNIEMRTLNQHKGIFECNQLCRCSPDCGNRVVQKGVTSPFQIRRTSGCGWGLFAESFIPAGKFLVEYCGIIVSDLEADNRVHQGHSYLFQLESGYKEYNGIFCMDAGPKGNFARFLNHSCTPNAAPYWYYCDIQDMRFPRVAMFSTENIAAGEQVCFDYGKSFWQRENSDFACECGSYACYYRKPERDRSSGPTTSRKKSF